MPGSKMVRGCRCAAPATSAGPARQAAAPANSDIVINLVRPTAAGDLPMRRIFQDRQGNEVGRSICGTVDTTSANGPGTGNDEIGQGLCNAALSCLQHRAPVITVSAPLRGKVRACCRRPQARHLQRFRPGPASGTAWHGHDLRPGVRSSLHPDFAEFVARAMTDPSASQLPGIDEVKSGAVASVLTRHPRDNNEGIVRRCRTSYLFRMSSSLSASDMAPAFAAGGPDDFVQNVRRLQFTGLVLAIVVGAAFIPMVWIFGSR